MFLQEKTESTDEEQMLITLANLEEKLNKLKEFSKQSEELRIARKKMVEDLGISNKHNIASQSKMLARRVQFSEDNDDESRGREPRKALGTFLAKAQKSNSLYSLLTGLNTWQEESKSKKTEIEMLKTKRQNLKESEEIIGYEEKIRNLEIENNELSDDILHFILQNMNEGKEEYEDLIQHLEDENKAMEDTISTLCEQVKFLKENNRGLMLENYSLRQKKFGLTKTLSKEDMERTYQRSLISKMSSVMLVEDKMYLTLQDLQASPSVQCILSMVS